MNALDAVKLYFKEIYDADYSNISININTNNLTEMRLVTLCNALLEELNGCCWCCQNAEPWENRPKGSTMIQCRFMSELYREGSKGIAITPAGKKNCSHWQWKPTN